MQAFHQRPVFPGRLAPSAPPRTLPLDHHPALLLASFRWPWVLLWINRGMAGRQGLGHRAYGTARGSGWWSAKALSAVGVATGSALHYPILTPSLQNIPH